MSYNFFCHNYYPVTRFECGPYVCSLLETTYGSTWSTFLDDAETPSFVAPDGYFITPTVPTGNVLNFQTLPVGKLPPVDVCDADTNRRYLRMYDDVGGTVTYVSPAAESDTACGNDVFRAIIGPAGQTLVGISQESRINTFFRWVFYFQNPSNVWLKTYVNVYVRNIDSNTDGTYDTLRVTVTHNGSGSYWVEEPDATNWDNSITAAEYAAIWPSMPFSGAQPVDQGTSPSSDYDFLISDLFPDSNYLWVPIEIDVSIGNIFSQSLTGRSGFSNRESYWFRPSTKIRIGDEDEVTIEMPGDMMIANDGSDYSGHTGYPSTIPAGESTSNIFFWAANTTTHAVALGGIGSPSDDWDTFLTTYKRNISTYTPPDDC